MYGDDTIPEPRQGRGPVRLINADTAVANLDGAAFDMGKNELFVDDERRVQVRLIRKMGSSYEMRVERGE
jgi:hypothetical protein